MLDNKKNLKNAKLGKYLIKNKLDDLSSIKNLLSLNSSIIEASKTAIKAKNNEFAFKMIENLSEKPELWFEFLSVLI